MFDGKFLSLKVSSVHLNYCSLSTFDIFEVNEGVSTLHDHFSNIAEFLKGKSNVVSGDCASNSTDVDLSLEARVFVTPR